MNLSKQSLDRIAKAVKTVESSKRSISGRRADVKNEDIVSAAFEITAVSEDTLTCEFVAELDANGNPVKKTDAASITIAKPFLLRISPFNNQTRNGITYTFPTIDKRVATDETDTEIQKLTPSYIARVGTTPGGILLAIRSHTGLTTGEEPNQKQVEWSDLNTDGRCWAVTDEEPLEPDDVPLGSYVPPA